MSDPTAVNPTFTAPSSKATLTFDLIATDSLGLVSTPDDVIVTAQEMRVYLPMAIRQR